MYCVLCVVLCVVCCVLCVVLCFVCVCVCVCVDSPLYRSDRTFWVTNGTSTANKIVVQGLTKPGDIVLVDRNCHKSHHLGKQPTFFKPYKAKEFSFSSPPPRQNNLIGLSLIGASVVYLEAYPLRQYAMYGAVPLRTIKQTLLDFKAAGTLHKVKLLLYVHFVNSFFFFSFFF